MRSKAIQIFKKLLMQERERLAEKLRKTVLEDFSNEPIDEADTCASIIDQTLNIKLLNRETRLLKKIEKAVIR